MDAGWMASDTLPSLHELPHVNANEHAHKVRSMCCETFCDLQRFYQSDQTSLYRMLDLDFHQRLGPPVEPKFGRFERPKCHACDHATAEEALAQCPPEIGKSTVWRSSSAHSQSRNVSHTTLD